MTSKIKVLEGNMTEDLRDLGNVKFFLNKTAETMPLETKREKGQKNLDQCINRASHNCHSLLLQ